MRRLAPVAVLFVVLLALVVWKETSRAGLGDVAASGDIVALAPAPFEVKDVAKVEVWAPGEAEPAFGVVREGDRWLVTAPFRAPAHVNHVEDLAKRLAEADAELRTEDAGALADLHLSPEKAVAVKLSAADGRVLAHVGIGKSSQRQGAFVRRLGEGADSRGWFTTTDLRRLLGLARTQEGDVLPEIPKPGHFHDATFPHVDLRKAARIELTAPRRRIVLEKRGAAWAAVEGAPAVPVNDQGVSQMLEKFGSGFQPKGLADPRDLAKLGLAEPKHVLAVSLEDGTVRKVFGAAEPSGDTCFVRLDAQQDPDIVYDATSWEWQRLFPTGASLFELKPLEVVDANVHRIVVTTSAKAGDARLEIVREGTKRDDEWKIVAPAWPLAARQSSLRSLASILHNVRPTDWCDGADIGEEHAVLRYGKRDVPEGDLATIRIGGKAPSGRDRLTLFPGDAERAWVLSDSTADRVAVPLLSVFETKLLHGWTEGDVTAVRLARRVGDAWTDAFAIEREAGKPWMFARGAEAKVPAEAAAAKKWVDALLAAEVREVGGDGAATVRVVVERSSGTPLELTLSEEEDGRRTGALGEFRFACDTKDLVPADGALLPAAPEPKPPDEKKE